jgi:hypothetical protein
MNILSLKFFKLLRQRILKLKSLLKAHEKAKKDFDHEWGHIDLKVYTMVDRTPGGRKCDLLTSVHMGSRHLDQARIWHKAGKARWDHNNNEQIYKPRELKVDPQLEYMYDKLGLSKDLEQTALGPQNHVT